MNAEVLTFDLAKTRKWLCSYEGCRRVMMRRSHLNDPAYCDYKCGCQGQPDKVLVGAG